MKPHPHRRRRPTVPFGEWRISLDLEATREIASAPALARGCRCPWCRNWAAAWDRVLPAEVVDGLRRLGIDPADPADLWASGDDPAATRYAVLYYCVGVVRDGPAAYRYDPVLESSVRHTHTWRSADVQLEVSVFPQRLGFDFPFKPPVQHPVPGLVQVDFCMTVPWLLDEEHPFVTQARELPKQPVVWKRGRLQPVLERRRSRWRVRAADNPI